VLRGPSAQWRSLSGCAPLPVLVLSPAGADHLPVRPPFLLSPFALLPLLSSRLPRASSKGDLQPRDLLSLYSPLFASLSPRVPEERHRLSSLPADLDGEPVRTVSRLLPVVQARSADEDGFGHQLGRVALHHHLPPLGATFTAAHSPTTFLGFRFLASSGPASVTVARCGDPYRFRPRQRFYPQVVPSSPAPLHPSSDRRGSDQSNSAGTSRTRSHS